MFPLDARCAPWGLCSKPATTQQSDAAGLGPKTMQTNYSSKHIRWPLGKRQNECCFLHHSRLWSVLQYSRCKFLLPSTTVLQWHLCERDAMTVSNKAKLPKCAVMSLQAWTIWGSPEDNSELSDWLGVPGGTCGAPRDPQTGRGRSVPECLSICSPAGSHHSHSQQRWSVQFSSVHDGIYALGEARVRSSSSVRHFPNVAFETVPMFDWRRPSPVLSRKIV